MMRTLAVLAVAAALGVLLPACSGGGDKGSGAGAAGEGPARPGTEGGAKAAPEPVKSAGKIEVPDPAAPPAPPSPPAAPKSVIPADGGPVEKTASGLSYSVLRAGTGTVHPKHGDLVTVHYTGWLEDGTEFDSSRPRGEPAQFAVGQLIEGWNEALTLMTRGAHWKLYIPAALGYGEGGSPPRIPPGANLVFEVELVDVRAVPEFRAPHPEAQKKSAGGTAYEVLEEGTGPACGEKDSFELDYAFWTPEGELLECSVSSGRTIAGRPEDMALPFLKEIPLLMKEGDTFLLDVPYEQGFGSRGGRKLPPGTHSIWRLTLRHVGHPVDPPAFEMPAEADLRTLPSGLKIRPLKEGTGPSPRLGQEVVVHYTGWLTDGTVFDSSWSRGLPATFRLGQVIPGWNEGLQLMKAGGEAILVIPPALAYGPRGAGTKVPPNATLVFRVQLVELKP